MQTAFYVAGAVAVLATLLAITRANVVHALLYLVVSFFGVAVVLWTLGAPFVAALEIIVYAGAIVVLFLFVVMLLNPGAPEVARERSLLTASTWGGPALLAAILLVETALLLAGGGREAEAVLSGRTQAPQAIGRSLFGPYLLAVELVGMLLLAALVAAHHVGRREGRDGP